jgi:hypothetical protein
MKNIITSIIFLLVINSKLVGQNMPAKQYQVNLSVNPALWLNPDRAFGATIEVRNLKSNLAFVFSPAYVYNWFDPTNYSPQGQIVSKIHTNGIVLSNAFRKYYRGKNFLSLMADYKYVSLNFQNSGTTTNLFLYQGNNTINKNKLSLHVTWGKQNNISEKLLLEVEAGVGVGFKQYRYNDNKVDAMNLLHNGFLFDAESRSGATPSVKFNFRIGYRS